MEKLLIKIFLKLFQSCIHPISTFRSGGWGPFESMHYDKWDSPAIICSSVYIELTHLFFRKNILGVNKTATNNFVRGELRLFSVKTSIYIRSIEFYKYLMNSYNKSLKELCIDKGLYLGGVKNTLNEHIRSSQQNAVTFDLFLLSCSKKRVKTS